jgi:hypothetical protein
VEDADPARLAAVRTASLTLFHAALDRKLLARAMFAPLGTPGEAECR